MTTCDPAVPHVSAHPLDVLPFFRRWQPSALRNVLYTGLWNLLIVLFMAAANKMFSPNSVSYSSLFFPLFFVVNIVGFMIHALLVVGDVLLRGWPSRVRGWPRMLYYMTMVSGCVIVGVSVGSALLRGQSPLKYLQQSSVLLTLLPFALFAAFFMLAVVVSGERRLASEAQLARQKEDMASAARLLAEARLGALQAQIEPHFLYNTLANVVSLIDSQPATARHMLERFIDYLRASLDASRAERATLGAELDLAGAYLDVLAVRMGARLRYRIEADEALRGIPIAPMLLQPVVENAVKHGLEPTVNGGDIVLRASRQGAMLVLEVSDNGAGLVEAPPRPGGGVGLSNLRDRLRSIYDGAAQVQLIENPGGGITVRIQLPLAP